MALVYNFGLKARRFRRCSHVIRFCRENSDLFSPVWSTDRTYSAKMVTKNSSFQKRFPDGRVLKTPFCCTGYFRWLKTEVFENWLRHGVGYQ